MRHTDLKTTLRYTHLEVEDLAKGAEAIPSFDSESLARRANLMPTGPCVSMPDRATRCSESSENEKDLNAGNANGVHDLAAPCNSVQGPAQIVALIEKKWRRRESKQTGRFQ
jgi:hypothetical protein